MHTWLSSLTRRAAVVLLLSGCTAAPVLGPGAPAAWSAPVDPTACPAPASGTLADFFDKAVPGGLARDRAPGAVVSVVAGDLAVTAAAAVWTVRGWRGSGAGVIARTHQLVLFTGLTALTWFLLQWNLMGWQF